MEADSDDISFVEEGEEEDIVTRLRRTSRPSNNTDVSAEGADPLLSGLNMSGANSWQVTAAAEAGLPNSMDYGLIHDALNAYGASLCSLLVTTSSTWQRRVLPGYCCTRNAVVYL
jgi:hypothetical protein